MLLTYIKKYASNIFIALNFTFGGFRAFPLADAFPPLGGEGGGRAAGMTFAFGFFALEALGPSWAVVGGFN